MEHNDSSQLSKFGMFRQSVAFLLLFFGAAFVLLYMGSSTTLKDYKEKALMSGDRALLGMHYDKVITQSIAYPEIRPQLVKAMDDGVLTGNEFLEIIGDRKLVDGNKKILIEYLELVSDE